MSELLMISDMEAVKARYPDACVMGMWAIFGGHHRLSHWCDSSKEAWASARAFVDAELLAAQRSGGER